MIDFFYDKYVVLRGIIGVENYIDNGKEIVEEIVY